MINHHSHLDDDLYDDDEDTQKDMFLSFRLDSEEYAIEIRYVTEIVGIQKITEVPDTEEFIKGVINLRGKIIPVLDVRLRFRLAPRDYTDRTCTIVVDMNSVAIGLIVDEVSEVLNIPESEISEAPKTNKGTRSRFIQGIGKVGEDVKIILNIDSILNDAELSAIAGAEAQEAASA
jgi:purine-binding chemotaxis protein CheW